MVGNIIGLNALDEPVLGSITGIETLHWWNPNGVQNVVIGGSAPGEGNEIAGHLDSGISVANTYAGVRISGNSIHDNSGIGIDLVTPPFDYGVTPNDPLDADSGGNKLQNFPVLTLAEGNSSQITIGGTLNSIAASDFTLEFFANTECDASSYGEGENFLGSTTVTTDGSGNAAFELVLSVMVLDGEAITSTATDTSGNTSEFSLCLTATIVPTQNCPGDANGDGAVDPLDSGYVQARFGCSVGTGDVGCDAADANHDGLVDPLDVGFMQARFGACP
jgi:hypothetical protein